MRDHTDKLVWRDKVPLALALVAQSYVVFIWYQKSTHGIHPYVDFAIALAAGVALDWLTVSTVMGRREGRTSLWSWLTSVGTFVGSATIAYDTYAVQWWPLDGKALLHICYPLVVLLYSLHLASPRLGIRTTTPLSVHPPSERDNALLGEEQGEPLPELPPSDDRPEALLLARPNTYPCPNCQAPLQSPGEMGAAKRWGYCRHCKGQTTVMLTAPFEQAADVGAPE